MTVQATAIILGNCQIDTSVYIGHYSIIGAPLPNERYGRESATNTPWGESRGVIIKSNVLIESHAIIHDGTTIEPGVWIASRVRVGHDTIIATNAELYYQCQVYDRVRIGEGAAVGGFLCNDSVIGRGAIVLGNLVHRFVDATYGVPEPAPHVEEEAFIGMGAIVIGGVTVGARAYVGAGAVLTSNATPDRLYLGTPARDCGPAPRPLVNKVSANPSKIPPR